MTSSVTKAIDVNAECDKAVIAFLGRAIDRMRAWDENSNIMPCLMHLVHHKWNCLVLE